MGLSLSTDVLAHAIHYAVLGAGVVGLLALIGPQLLGRAPRSEPADEHTRRVRMLREQVTTGSLGTTLTVFPTATTPATTPGATTGRKSTFLLPTAIVSSTAAAGVHAAVGPDHFRERLLFGLFFACAALTQIAWSILVAWRPSRLLLGLAVLGNVAVVALWAVTRTVGLGGILPTPEDLGPWDVACVVWELTTATCAWLLLRAARGAPELPRWAGWDHRARGWAIGSAAVLAALTVSGAHA